MRGKVGVETWGDLKFLVESVLSFTLFLGEMQEQPSITAEKASECSMVRVIGGGDRLRWAAVAFSWRV